MLVRSHEVALGSIFEGAYASRSVSRLCADAGKAS